MKTKPSDISTVKKVAKKNGIQLTQEQIANISIQLRAEIDDEVGQDFLERVQEYFTEGLDIVNNDE